MMGYVAEQREHGEAPSGGQQDTTPDGASELEQHTAGEPGPPGIDSDQLRQFQQFQQFQEFQRYQQLQHRPGHHPAAPPPQQQSPQLPQQQPQPPQSPQSPRRRRLRAPRLVRWLLKKVLAWLIAVIVVVLLLNWVTTSVLGVSVLDSLFGSDDEEQPAAETGGGTYHTNTILKKDPYAAVRGVYDMIAKDVKEPLQTCGRFDRKTRQVFATHLGYDDCAEAVRQLQSQVTDANAYAESVSRRSQSSHNDDTVRISSCDFDISGGPALGTFTVHQVDRGQWLITGHSTGPRQCPTPSVSGPTR